MTHYRKLDTMFDKKTILFFALAAVVILLWGAWQKDHPAQVIPRQESTTQITTSMPPAKAETTETAVPAARIIHVRTDVVDVQIDKVGGNIINLQLLKYPTSYSTPHDPVQLFSNSLQDFYVPQLNVIGSSGPDQSQQRVFNTSQTNYVLQQNQDNLIVELVWKNADGLVVTKSYTFKRGKYDIEINYWVDNKTKQSWSGNVYSQFKRQGITDDEGIFGLHTFRGAALSTPENLYQKITYKKLDEKNLNGQGKINWLVMQQRYFVSALIPRTTQDYNYYSSVTQVGPTNKSKDRLYTIGFASPKIVVEPGQKASFPYTLYAGPEIASVLSSVAPHLDLVIDYGWLAIFSVPIFKAMQIIYFFVGNWGWAIVLITLFIKLIFYKLSETSYRSMAKLRNLQPRLLALKERYGEDRQKLSQATMDLYRKEKVNPLGGCLPMVIQIPVFIALYYVLIASVELRQAPFIWWIHDLSVKDPYYILPVLMGLSWIGQQMLNPPPPDPMQAKMMMVIPIIFTFLFATFPAGLVLYWLVNNVLSILQQWYIMRKFEVQEKKKKTRK